MKLALPAQIFRLPTSRYICLSFLIWWKINKASKRQIFYNSLIILPSIDSCFGWVEFRAGFRRQWSSEFYYKFIFDQVIDVNPANSKIPNHVLTIYWSRYYRCCFSIFPWLNWNWNWNWKRVKIDWTRYSRTTANVRHLPSMICKLSTSYYLLKNLG